MGDVPVNVARLIIDAFFPGLVGELKSLSGLDHIPAVFLGFAVASEFAFCLFCIYVHTFLHEMGHLLAYLLVGIPVRTVRICVAGFRSRFFGNTKFLIGLVPVGFTGNPEKPHALQPTPLKQIVVSLGGIGITAVITIISLVIATCVTGLLKLHIGLFGAIGVYSVFSNSAGNGTDGARLLFALRRLRGGPWPEELPEAARFDQAFAVAQIIAIVSFFLTVQTICR